MMLAHLRETLLGFLGALQCGGKLLPAPEFLTKVRIHWPHSDPRACRWTPGRARGFDCRNVCDAAARRGSVLSRTT